ncbi:polysaccharide pyruvyl transferase family protein [Algibacter sp. PT7-4]|uniref:polysaccharide pyruvyl transferase family protein n=1 Tax=Algibacter ulvanivorans TaxID=3400999 RepID=UPI003AB0ABD2
MQKIITSVKRNIKKRRTIKTILTSEQQNKSVVNIHRIDNRNIGDYFCAPHLYFAPLKDKQLDIFDYKSLNNVVTNNWINQITNNALIIGGGGLLNRGSFDKQLHLFEQLKAKGKKTVLWGVGHNSKNKNEFGSISSYNIDINKFGLAGVRDYSMKATWVPCVSCMHPIFNNAFNETQEIGIIYHKKTIKNKQILNKLQNYPSTSNTTNLEDIISFIGKSNTIVTDSYHAMYWSMLLGKKVLAVPNSSKFFDFKYPPVITSFNNFKHDLHKAKAYSGVLEECREINIQFSKKVFNYLEI